MIRASRRQSGSSLADAHWGSSLASSPGAAQVERARLLWPAWAALLALACAIWPAAVHAQAQPAAGGQPLQAVTLQLKWKHQFQFAGYYAALQQGYYRQAGLDVTLAEAGPEQDSATPVLEGRAQYGVGDSSLVLLRQLGRPLVVLAVVLQHSPNIYIARGEVDHVHALVGKRVMQEASADELFAYLHKEGVHPEQLRFVPHDFSAADLLAGKVDAISAYSTDELFDVRAAGKPFTVLTPRSAGIDFYGDNLFTTEEEIRQHPARAKAFREASLKGWQYAMAHPEEVADLILERYSRRHGREHLLFEAREMQRLMQPELVEIGQVNPGRWLHIAEVYQELGMLKSTELKGFIYSPAAPRPSRLYVALAVFAAATLVLGGVVAYLRRLNHRLRLAHSALQARVHEIEALQARLHEQAVRDPLTGMFNRRYMDETLEHELARARRYHYPLALVMLDVDHFKRVNDTFGHAGGDELLRRLGRLLRENCRGGDIACRYGGEEFMLLLPGLDEPALHERAEFWRCSVEALSITYGSATFHVTASIGVAVFPSHAQDVPSLQRCADRALYTAKTGGRNRVVFAQPATAQDAGALSLNAAPCRAAAASSAESAAAASTV
ncbi:GGDEF domain-containing protein [Azohydromonas lata]|uniref:GGDEF domain-containing protein n=1 Tax=Azohydromonas lata TaxID=45677 RepID=UPI0014710D50|nr:GGDEF domain-containing protein [Azohydromonas lata]